VLEGAAAFFPTVVELAGDGEPERVRVERVTEDFFPVLGVPALLGRTFTAGDYRDAARGRDPGTIAIGDAAVLAYGFWQRRFGGDPAAVGRTIRLNGKAVTIVGIMPAEFQGVGGGCPLWLPWWLTPEQRENRQTHEFFALARLKSDVGLARARAEMSALYRGLAERFPAENAGWDVELTPWRGLILGHARPALLVLLAAAGIMLAIASANVAGLLLARAVDREREMAIRLALGASRSRIVRQLVTEGLLLAAVAGGLSLLVARSAVGALSALRLPTAVEFAFPPRVDARVFAATAGVSLLAGLLVGLAPALHAARVDLRNRIGGGPVVGERRARARNGLVLAEIALGAILLAAGGLMLESLQNLRHAALGFEPRRLSALELNLPDQRYPDDDSVRRFVSRLLDDVGALPGVESVASASDVPLQDVSLNLRFAIEGRPATSTDRFSASALAVSPAYFRTIGATLVRGRAFDTRDTREAPGALVIDETLARAYWPDEDPLGKRIAFPYPDLRGRSFVVVGIVRAVQYRKPGQVTERTLYLPQVEVPFRDSFLLVRASTSSADAMGAVRRSMHAADPALAQNAPRALEDVARDVLATPRLLTGLLGLFAGLSLLLALAGLYGLLAYTVARRTPEIGVRVALGAGRSDVVRLVMGRGLALTGIGIAVGLGMALGLTRFLGTLLYGVGPADPPTYAAVAAILALVAAAACYIPARRAARIEPAVALRRE
jgi:putative ABC transport system permease protein